MYRYFHREENEGRPYGLNETRAWISDMRHVFEDQRGNERGTLNRGVSLTAVLVDEDG